MNTINKTILKTFAYKARKQINLNKNLALKYFLYYVTMKYQIANSYLKDFNLCNKEAFISNVYSLSFIIPSFYKPLTFEEEKEFPFESFSDDVDNTEYTKGVEVIGWLYQYFNTTEKNEAFSKLMRSEKITVDYVPAATQVFTPFWIVKYLVENTVIYNENTNLEELNIIDPCMGSGNILIYVFDYLMKAYLNKGYKKEEAALNILTKNIYGLDIDINAYKLTSFALLMKGLEYNLDISKITLKNIRYIPNSKDITRTNNDRIDTLLDLYSNASNIGSLLITPNEDIRCTNEDILPFIKVNSILTKKYDAVITNPPYMGKKSLNKELITYIDNNYTLGKSELYSAFILRCLDMCKDKGYVGMITIHSWMFISSFKGLRKEIIEKYTLESMVHTGAGTFEELNSFNALATSFVIRKEKSDKDTLFIRLAHIYDYETKIKEYSNKDNYYYLNIKSFLEIPGYPFVYWADKQTRKIFKERTELGSIFPIKQGLATGDNKRFVRYWFEVKKSMINFNAHNIKEALESGYKWFPYNKGGNYRKWYGMNEYIVDWFNNGYEIKSQRSDNRQKSRPQNTNYYFQKGITWSLFGFENFSVRYKDYGFIFDVSGSTMFPSDKYLYYTLGFLASNVCFHFLSLLAPTVNFQVGNISSLPIIFNDEYLEEINKLVKENIKLSKIDWDNQETSWDFDVHPFLKYQKNTLKERYEEYAKEQNKLYNKVKANEERINVIFNLIYNTNIETKVLERDIAIKKPNEKEAMKSYISYIIGTFLGRFKSSNKTYKTITIEELTKVINTNCYNINNCYSNNCYINEVINVKEFIEKEFYQYHYRMYQKHPIYVIYEENTKSDDKVLTYIFNDYKEEVLNHFSSNIKFKNKLEKQIMNYDCYKERIKDFLDSQKGLIRILK